MYRSTTPDLALLALHVPHWAVPPAYAPTAAEGMVGAVLAGHPDHDLAWTVIDQLTSSYGHAVSKPGAPPQVVQAAGRWQLGAHLAAAAVVARLQADDADPALIKLATELVTQAWPWWGQVSEPSLARLHAGLTAHRHITAWGTPAGTAFELTDLIRCATRPGDAQLPAAQHRLIARLVQQPTRLHGLHQLLPADPTT
ncbi:hypothetical protein ACFO1B_43880 [Dactylosporangium siamense]|uniref:Uncharacterized protein n=1 Tax=Dactylosporangium siamense TaxID=685454 RepID=A0A919Q2M5_9ACTN|nr:hypothetical protein [Dactylosporangium siamense]GIG53163.1 hypothetical protein Dsi01nite_112040 [Dactylosporangium siamense]